MTDRKKPSAGFWITVALVALLVGYPLAQAKPDEPEKAPTPAADAMRGNEPGEVRDDNGLKIKLVWCPLGTFTMGSPKAEGGRSRLSSENQAEVTLTQGYWLGKYEVTQSEWKAVMKIEPWKGKGRRKEGADFPATLVSWDDATVFCRKLTEQEREAGRLPKDWEYTLPTEAQWEHACRARTKTSFSFGDDESKLGDYAWFDKNAENAGEEYAHRVGQKKTNPWGLCDMHGNVWEWCRDICTDKLPGGRDPEVTPDKKTKGSFRVIRGGSWGNAAGECRSACRGPFDPSDRDDSLGFRVARSPSR